MARAQKTLDLSKVFPHWCKIYSFGTVDPLSDEESEVIVHYEGRCRDEGNAAMRTYMTDGVLKSDHALQIPILIKDVPNDAWVDIRNDCVEITQRQVTSCQPFRLYSDILRKGGTTVFYNEAKN